MTNTWDGLRSTWHFTLLSQVSTILHVSASRTRRVPSDWVLSGSRLVDSLTAREAVHASDSRAKRTSWLPYALDLFAVEHVFLACARL